MVKNWLITGGCGFIGINLIKRILKVFPDNNIRVLDNLSVGTKDDMSSVTAFKEYNICDIKTFPKGIELVVGDIRDFDTCLSCCTGINIVVHLAANTGVSPSVENPRQDMETNIIGTFNILEASRLNKIESFIFASSGAPVGEVDPPITEDKAPKPISPYGASKLAGEGYCSAYYRTYGLKTISLRFSNVYGPGSHHKQSVVAKFFRNALTMKPIEIYGDGCQTRDFLYIDDLIDAILLSVETDFGGEVFHISSQKETSINEVSNKIKHIIEALMPIKVSIVYKGKRTGDVIRNYADHTKARKMIRYIPKYDLDTGLKNTFDFFKEIYKPL